MKNLRTSLTILMSNYLSSTLINLMILLKLKNIHLNDSKRNVVYKIDCKNCNASCVGQTGRKLNTRIKEYHNDI